MENVLKKIGLRAIAMINENIRAGISFDGTRFEYSTKPFFRPYDPKIAKMLGEEGRLWNMTRSKSTGKLGMVILGGYKQYKEYVHPDAKDDFLTVSGRMLRNLQITGIDTPPNPLSRGGVTIGFTDPEQEKKAFWLNVSGVGRSRRLWRFLGLLKAQEEELGIMAAEELKMQPGSILDVVGGILQREVNNE